MVATVNLMRCGFNFRSDGSIIAFTVKASFVFLYVHLDSNTLILDLAYHNPPRVKENKSIHILFVCDHVQ